MKKLITIVSLIFVCGCVRKALGTDKTYNGEFQVSLLFEHDECKVYRFKDVGDWRYFTNCKGSTTSKVSCGEH